MTYADGHPSAPEQDQAEHTSIPLELSNAVVRIHKEFYGKGPTKARSHFSGDLVTVLLEGGYTRSEETLMGHGHTDEVVRARLAMQESVEFEFRTAVEQILGRRVRSFMSANDPAGGFQAEIFVLEPRASAEQPLSDMDALSERARRAKEAHRDLLDEHRALRAEQVQTRRKPP